MSLKNSVVLEIGSAYIRGGFSGEMLPRFVDNVMMTSVSCSPDHRTAILEKLYVLFNEKLMVKPKEGNVISSTVEGRTGYSYVIFSSSFWNSLSKSSYGCRSGLVVDIGYEEIRSIAVCWGRPLLPTLKVSPIGVKHAMERFRMQLECTLGDTLFPLDVCKELHEKIVLSSSSTPPAGVVVALRDLEFTVPGSLRSDSLSELLSGRQNDGFDVSDDEIGGLVGLIYRTLLSCALDVRSEVIRNVVFCGGGATIPGLSHTVKQELLKRAQVLPCFESFEIRRIPFERSLLTWIGGSIYSSLRSNDETFVCNITSEKQVSSLPDWMPISRRRALI